MNSIVRDWAVLRLLKDCFPNDCLEFKPAPDGNYNLHWRSKDTNQRMTYIFTPKTNEVFTQVVEIIKDIRKIKKGKPRRSERKEASNVCKDI